MNYAMLILFLLYTCWHYWQLNSILIQLKFTQKCVKKLQNDILEIGSDFYEVQRNNCLSKLITENESDGASEDDK